MFLPVVETLPETYIGGEVIKTLNALTESRYDYYIIF